MRVLLIIAFFFFHFQSFAQQCGYDHYYLFAVNVHGPLSETKIPNLKMYLTDEKGTACRAEVIFMEDRQWKHRMDTLFFWDNYSIRKNDGSRPLIRRKFYNLGDYYLVAFRLETNDLKDPLKYPVYQLKIEADINKLTGQSYPEQFFHLPLAKSIRICNNGILDDFRLVTPVQTLDKKDFKPIDIILGSHESTVLAEDPMSQYPQFVVRFEYAKSINAVAYNREEFKVKAASIYDTRDGKVCQQINIPSSVISESITSNRLVQSGDFYQREIKEALDFSVIMEEWRDTIFNAHRKKTNFYLFNPKTKQYALDSFLSRETDLTYYPPLKKFRRLEYLLTEKSKIINEYELVKKQWKLIDRREEFFPAFKPKVKYPPGACLIFAEKYHRLPVKVVNGINATVAVRDSFRIYNNCDDTIQILSVKSPNRDFFQISQTLLPHQYTTLVFEGVVRNSSFDFITNSFYCYLGLADNTTLGFSIDIPTVSNNSKLAYRADSTLIYSIAQRPHSRFSKATFTYPDGNIRAIGYLQDGDTALKVGKWQYYQNGEWKLTEIVYSKELTLSVLNEAYSYGKRPVYFKVLENGVWKQPVLQNDNGAQTFYITAATDSILAYADSLSYSFRLPYQGLPDNIQKQFYLLKPGERTLKIGYYLMPFSTISHHYAIIPDNLISRNPRQTTYQMTDSIIRHLQKQYPKLAHVYISRNGRGISMESLSADMRQKLLAQLKADKGIAFVSQLFSIAVKGTMTYCDNRVYVELKGNQPDSLKNAALALGFSNMQADMGYNRYWLTYESKIIDEGFFEAFKKLTELPWVMSAHFNHYLEQEPDVGMIIQFFTVERDLTAKKRRRKGTQRQLLRFASDMINSPKHSRQF
ncbi:MAG: hypothetical protein IPG86_19570 [Chitinophagaceae bacterium]|nr:hypothetical protein [Chitinophagaceae bacterium]